MNLPPDTVLLDQDAALLGPVRFAERCKFGDRIRPDAMELIGSLRDSRTSGCVS